MKNNEILRLGLILFTISFTVTLVLALGNLITEERIQALNKQTQEEARRSVLPDAVEFEEVNIEGLGEGVYEMVQNVFVGKANGSIVGYCVGVAPNGYGGAIEMIVGIDTQLKVSGMNIVNFSETPGLGAKASEEAFKNQYKGKGGSEPLNVIKNGTPKENEIVAISGATVTTNAVTDGVNTAIQFVQEKIAENAGGEE